jgi:aromatic-L-amino-acid decarboxylase
MPTLATPARDTPTLDEPARDALNQQILTRVQLGGGAFLTSTVLDGRFWLRACIINPRTCRDDLQALVELVRAAASG